MALSAMVRRLLGNALVSTSGAKELADAVDAAALGPKLNANNVWTGLNTFNGATTFNQAAQFNSGFQVQLPDGQTATFFAFQGNAKMQFAGAIDFMNQSIVGGQLNLGVDPTDLIGFNGAVPTPRRVGAAQVQVATTAPTNVSPYGFTQAQATAILTLLNELQAALVQKGLIKGSA